MKNTFFSTEWFFRAKKIFSRTDCNLLLYVKFTKIRDSLNWNKKFRFYSQKHVFYEVLTGKAFKHCMFELRLQIDLYYQNLVRKKRILISNLILSNKIIFQKKKHNSNTERVYTFLKLDFVFLCCVQGV